MPLAPVQNEYAGPVWDVVVVGAGPSGSSAAHSAASGGARVLVLEKAALPRYKTCGGGLIGTSMASLPPGLQPDVVDEVRRVTFTHHGRWARTRGVPEDAPRLLGLIRRAELDYRLVTAAQRRGAVLRTGVTAKEVCVLPGGAAGPDLVRVRCADGTVLLARCLVGTDGSASRVGAYVGVRCDQVDLGLEAEIPVPPALARRWSGRIALDWGTIPGSYGWVFPKRDTLSVGVIAARDNKGATRDYFERFLTRHGLSEYPAQISSGHLTRCRAPESPLHRGPVLVAGDAAGLLEPWTREGISFALRSGRLAGERAALIARARGPAAAEELGAAYRADVLAGIGEEMRVGRALLGLFGSAPWLFHAAVTMCPPAWRGFVRFMRGDAAFPEIVQRNPLSRLLVEKAGSRATGAVSADRPVESGSAPGPLPVKPGVR